MGLDQELVQIAGTSLKIGTDHGALVVYLDEENRGTELEAHDEKADDSFFAHGIARKVGRRHLVAAIFPRLPCGRYKLVQDDKWPGGARTAHVSIFAQYAAEVDWQTEGQNDS